MISGDHIETAKSVAIAAGILDPDEAESGDAIMTGAEFRRAIGGAASVWNEQTGQRVSQPKSQAEFN
jgi:magnesium-transporting ATPase (P-type)